jgi:hypothetical protein
VMRKDEIKKRLCAAVDSMFAEPLILQSIINGIERRRQTVIRCLEMIERGEDCSYADHDYLHTKNWLGTCYKWSAQPDEWIFGEAASRLGSYQRADAEIFPELSERINAVMRKKDIQP